MISTNINIQEKGKRSHRRGNSSIRLLHKGSSSPAIMSSTWSAGKLSDFAGLAIQEQLASPKKIVIPKMQTLSPVTQHRLCSTPESLTTSTPSPPADARHSPNTRKKKKKDPIKFLIRILKKEDAFRRLSPKEVAKVMYKMTLWTGDVVFRQGQICDSYFILAKGRLDVFVQNRMGHPEKVSEVQRGGSLGINGLMGASKCRATVRASMPSVVWVLEAESFRKLFKKYRIYSADRLAFLKSVPILKSLPPLYLEHVATMLHEVQFEKGTVIIKQGDPACFFYLIKKGTAVVLKKAPRGETVQVKSYGSRDFFGERGLILKQPRAATVLATSELTCFVLTKTDFAEIGKILTKPFEQVIASYKTVELFTTAKFYNKIQTKLEEFIDLGVLGVGSFGRVSLVKDPNSKLTYSLKNVRKKRVVETDQQNHMRNERAVMAMLDSPFIVKLFATYKDRTRVYFLMEAVLGGELFTVLRFNKKFSEKTARFYGSCCVLAFEHMHSMDVIYRDLKPENLLLDQKGYIKLTDFGFAKIRNQTYTLCGTPEYLAPEIIQSCTQSFSVDWWGLGILIYEMVISHPPFEDAEHWKMYEKIIRKPVVYPQRLTQSCEDLIASLLRKNFQKRLGSGPDGAAHVKRHPWFKSINWAQLEKLKLKSPYVPKIKSREDISCFEYYPDDEFKDEELCDDNSPEYAWTADF